MATSPNPDYPTVCPRCHTDLTLYSGLTGCPVCARLAAELPSIIAQIREQAGLHAVDDLSTRVPASQAQPVQPLPPGEYQPSAELTALMRNPTGPLPTGDVIMAHGLGVLW